MSYSKIRKILLDNGFKCVDMTFDGDEVFEKDGVKFAVSEVQK